MFYDILFILKVATRLGGWGRVGKQSGAPCLPLAPPYRAMMHCPPPPINVYKLYNIIVQVLFKDLAELYHI